MITRSIDGDYFCIPHRFHSDGFLTSLILEEMFQYLFLFLVSDRYSFNTLVPLLKEQAKVIKEISDKHIP